MCNYINYLNGIKFRKAVPFEGVHKAVAQRTGAQKNPVVNKRLEQFKHMRPARFPAMRLPCKQYLQKLINLQAIHMHNENCSQLKTACQPSGHRHCMNKIRQSPYWLVLPPAKKQSPQPRLTTRKG